MSSWKTRWLEFVRSQSEKTAADPNAKAKLVGMLVLLMIVWAHIPKAEGSIIGCAPCVAWAAQVCSSLIAAGGACATVAMFPPALCACLLTFGGGACALAAGTCAAVCLAPTP